MLNVDIKDFDFFFEFLKGYWKSYLYQMVRMIKKEWFYSNIELKRN